MRLDEIKTFKKCPACGKENKTFGRRDDPGYCNKVCQGNDKYGKRHFGQDRYMEKL